MLGDRDDDAERAGQTHRFDSDSDSDSCLSLADSAHVEWSGMEWNGMESNFHALGDSTSLPVLGTVTVCDPHFQWNDGNQGVATLICKCDRCEGTSVA